MIEQFRRQRGGGDRGVEVVEVVEVAIDSVRTTSELTYIPFL